MYVEAGGRIARDGCLVRKVKATRSPSSSLKHADFWPFALSVGFRNFLHNEGVPVMEPKEKYYRQSDVELLKNEKLQEQRDNPCVIHPR